MKFKFIITLSYGKNLILQYKNIFLKRKFNYYPQEWQARTWAMIIAQSTLRFDFYYVI